MEKKQNQSLDKNQGKIVNLQGTAKIVTKMTQYGRDMQRKHQILEDARRIQPLPEDMRQDSRASCACPICTTKPEYKTRTARAVAAIRHTANNAWTWFENLADSAFVRLWK